MNPSVNSPNDGAYWPDPEILSVANGVYTLCTEGV